MTQIIGFFIVFALVALGLLATGASAVLSALPYELALIGGAALGTLLIGNSTRVAKSALGGFVIAFRGSRWKAEDFAQMLGVLSELARRTRRGGFVSIEADIEEPETSELIHSAPRLANDGLARDMLCDAFRLLALDLSDPARAEAQMDRALEMGVSQRMRAVTALHTVADALPALGIVAAVLGIIKTMTAIDESTAIIGAMIASALLGTFLGVFLAYGLVGPVASRFGQVIEDDAVALEVIRTFVSAHARGVAPAVSIELARAAIPAESQPATRDLDTAVQSIRFAVAGPRAA